MVEPVEGHGAVDQRVQQNSQGPGVHLRAPVRPSVDDLRGGVQGAAAEGLQEVVAVVEVGQAEVGDLKENRDTTRLFSTLRPSNGVATALLRRRPSAVTEHWKSCSSASRHQRFSDVPVGVVGFCVERLFQRSLILTNTCWSRS